MQKKAEREAALFEAILSDLEAPINGRTILDFGCGNGDIVQILLDRGVDAYGCDFKFKKGENADALYEQARLKLIEIEPYRLPFDDNIFDCVISDQVFEHVQDYNAANAEIRRVLKQGGLCLHMFPSRFKPIESHVMVPFSSIIRNRAWLTFWALCGVRTKKQSNMNAKEIVLYNREYLDRATNYLSGRKIQQNFLRFFDEVFYAERLFLKNSTSRRGELIYRIGKVFPLIFFLYRVFWARVLVARK